MICLLVYLSPRLNLLLGLGSCSCSYRTGHNHDNDHVHVGPREPGRDRRERCHGRLPVHGYC